MPISLSLTLSNIVSGGNIDDTDVTVPFTEVKTHLENTLNGVQPFEQVSLGATTELTIASGAITVTGSHHRVDTEGNAATDDLDTINGGSEGKIIWLRMENAARKVRLRHDVGNIYLSSKSNYTLDTQHETFPLIYTGSKWVDWSRGLRVEGVTVITPWAAMGTGPNSITGIPNTYPTLKLFMHVRLSSLAFITLRLNNSSLFDYSYMFTQFVHTDSLSTYQGLSEAGFQLPIVATSDPGYSTVEFTIVNANGSGVRSCHWNGFNPGTSQMRAHIGGGIWADSGSSGAVNRIDIANVSIGTGSQYMLLGMS